MEHNSPQDLMMIDKLINKEMPIVICASCCGISYKEAMGVPNVNSYQNPFARVLVEILGRHGKRLHQLETVPIHPEKIRRLMRSLSGGNAFPTLGPSELQQVIDELGLDEKEVHALHAGIIAAGVGEKITTRGLSDEAYKIANAIFDLLVNNEIAQDLPLDRIR